MKKKTKLKRYIQLSFPHGVRHSDCAEWGFKKVPKHLFPQLADIIRAVKPRKSHDTIDMGPFWRGS